jgi:hypothetical protein
VFILLSMSRTAAYFCIFVDCHTESAGTLPFRGANTGILIATRLSNNLECEGRNIFILKFVTKALLFFKLLEISCI